MGKEPSFRITLCSELISDGRAVWNREKAKDGIYHCIDRTDENPFKEAGNGTKQKRIDFEKLKICKKNVKKRQNPEFTVITVFSSE